jgi:hypothetical protein
MPIPKYRTKITQLFSQIKDPSVKLIIAEVVSIEYANRGSHHFPVKKIEDVVDSEANLIEIQKRKGELV